MYLILIIYIKLETNRILLRHWKESDAEDLFKAASNPKIGLNAGWSPHKNINESLEIIRTIFNTDAVYAIEYKDNKKVIGSIGYLTKDISHLRNLKENEVEIGYWVAEDYWNRGICTEALKLLIKFLFEIKKYKVIWGTFFVDNLASGKVMEKCGFKDTQETTYLNDLKEGKDRLVKIMKLEI